MNEPRPEDTPTYRLDPARPPTTEERVKVARDLLRGDGSSASGTPAVPADAAADPQASGTPFGRYRLLEKLGQGGMGVVWKAWDPELMRVVALKQILEGQADAQTTERFVREAQAAARLHHPNIAGVHDVGLLDGRHYFTTDYIEGRSLDRLVDGRPLPARTAMDLTKQVAEALAYAHAQGIVHRDVKPQNIIVDRHGKPFLMDFGLAKDVRQALGQGLTLSGQVLGTPAYMSPEQAKGRSEAIGPASDQFSLGVVLYELLTGTKPFLATTLPDLLTAVMGHEPTRPTRLNVQIHRDVETICLKAMEKDPSRRYASMDELAADVGRWLAGEPIAARPASRVELLLRGARRNRSVVIPIAAAAVVGLASLAWMGWAAHVTSKRAAQGLAEGAAFEREGRWDRAADAYAAVQAIDPGNEEARKGHERAEAARAAEAHARKTLESARVVLDRAAQSLYNKEARDEDVRWKAEAAQRLIEDALAKAPRLALGHDLLGRAWELRGEYDRAEASWRKALRLDPGLWLGHYDLGRLLLFHSFIASLGGSAEERLAHARSSAPLVEEASRELALAESGAEIADPVRKEVARGLLAYARADVTGLRAIARQGIDRFSHEPGLEELYWLAGMGASGKEELDFYDKAIEIRPKFPQVRLLRGNAREDGGDVTGALADYDELVKECPSLALAWYGRGRLRDDSKDAVGARADYDEAIRLDPGLIDAWVSRARLREDAEDFDGALADCDEALRRDPRAANICLLRGNIHRDQEKFAEAIVDYTAAIETDVRYAKAWASRGFVKRDMGDFAGAIADLDSALGITPEDPLALANRADAKAKSGDKAGAVADYEKALEVAPKEWPYRASVSEALERVRKESGK